MDSKTHDQGRPLGEFRNYLLLLARAQIAARLRGRMDASDVVQQTLLEAHRDLGQYSGQTEAQLAAWLRQILARNLANAIRDHGRAKRDVSRERSLEAALEQSSARLEAWLAADQSSPGQCVERHEAIDRLAKALTAVSDDQREALVLRHLQGRSLAEIAEVMSRSPSAVAGLLHRGLTGLRAKLRERE